MNERPTKDDLEKKVDEAFKALSVNERPNDKQITCFIEAIAELRKHYPFNAGAS